MAYFLMAAQSCLEALDRSMKSPANYWAVIASATGCSWVVSGVSILQ